MKKPSSILVAPLPFAVLLLLPLCTPTPWPIALVTTGIAISAAAVVITSILFIDVADKE